MSILDQGGHSIDSEPDVVVVCLTAFDLSRPYSLMIFPTPLSSMTSHSDRHESIDALTIACCAESMAQTVQLSKGIFSWKF